MKRAGVTVAVAAGALLLLTTLYLGWRVLSEREEVPTKIKRILARAESIDLPAHRIDALLRVEDPTFRTNRGIDLSSPGAGMTTISQSLGKQLFFADFEPGLRKLELMALTRFALYPMVDKDRTLRAFLASAYFGTNRGRPVIGFAEASRTWLGKPLSSLSDREFLGLVAMLPAPDTLKPGRDDGGREERVQRIERLLAGRCQPSGLRDVMLEGCA